jgi:hypothetical protein
MSGPCSIELLESAIAGRLPVDKEATLHRHLEECAACSAAIEQLAGGPTWCREAAALLTEDELDAAVPMREEWSDVDFTVEHLEPADQPNLLGRLGGYDVLEIIGRGGMGIVLKGFDRELKRCVAIKVLAPHLAQSSLARKRFAREAQAAAAVVHPHVLAIHQVQATGRLPFLVMPLVAGESLAQRIAAQGTLELREILRIGMQAAAGLSAAHEQGLVHRDVKPANILLERGVERAVLTDFGLARAADDVALTRWGVIAGTPQYMSPEQARGEPLDARSDLFSLGCVLYEMATGVSPFRTDSVMATMRRLIDDAPQSIAALNPELPAWFIAIVDCLLEKDPARRFGSAKEVSGLLEGCLAHVQQPAGVPLPTAVAELVTRQELQPVVEQIPEPASHGRGRRVVGRIALAIVFGAAFLGIFLKQATEPPDIAGPWSGDEWGDVVLTKTNDGEYTGTYSETLGKGPGEIQLRWSRIERRFNGSWREAEDRFGELSVRLVDTEIRGALTTDAKSKINPATPRLADLTWKMGVPNVATAIGSRDTKAVGRIPVRTLKRDIQIRFVSIPDEERFSLPKADSVELDWAAIQANPQAIVFGAPRLITMSGQECELEVGTDAVADARAHPTLKVRLRSTFDGQTVHYTARFSIISQQTSDDGARTTTHELNHSGDATLDQPQMVEIGQGADQRRYLAWIVFRQGEMSLPAVKASSSATFGPVMERVLPQGVPCREQYFQFRNGQVFVVGNGPGTSKEEAAHDEQRIEEAGGADMSAASGEDGVVLYGRGCFFTRDIGGLEWDGLTAEQVVERLKYATHVEGEARVMKKDLPFSYLFKTACGEVGIMEVLGVVDEKREGWTERGMKFRYKLVQGAGTKNIAKPGLNFGEATQGLQAALEVTPGEPFRLRIHIRNVSDHDISIHGTHYRQEDECLLTDADGKPVSVTKVTHDIKMGMKGGYFAPGQVAVFECAGLSFQSIDKAPPSAGYVAQATPGRYTLRVRLRLPGDDVPFVAGENAWKGELETGPVTIEVKDPATRTVAPVADAVWSSHLGKAVEITVNDLQTTRENCALSLDTGKLMFVPASITLDMLSQNKMTKAPAQSVAEAWVRAQEESLTWARNNQVDAVAFVTTKDGKVVKCGLLCPDVLVFHVENKAWTPDLADPQMLKEHFEKAMHEWNFIPPIAEITSDGDFPATYLILDTRTHRRGVLQILGTSNQPRGVKINYRLIEGAAVTRITPAEQSDAPRPAGAKLSVTQQQMAKPEAPPSAAPTPAVTADPLSVIELKVAEQQLEKTLTDLQDTRTELALLPTKPGLSKVAREAEVRKLDIKVRILEQQADRLREVIQHLASRNR